MLVLRDGFDFADSRGWESTAAIRSATRRRSGVESICACIMCWILDLSFIYGVSS